MRDSASEFCQRPAMRLGFVLRGGDAGVAVGQLGVAAVAVVDVDDPLDVVQLGGDRDKIRTSEAIRPSECPFSTLHCLRPLLKKRGNLSRPSVSYFTHARSARLYGLTDSIVAPGRMPGDTCGATGGRPRYEQSGAFERWARSTPGFDYPLLTAYPCPTRSKRQASLGNRRNLPGLGLAAFCAASSSGGHLVRNSDRWPNAGEEHARKTGRRRYAAVRGANWQDDRRIDAVVAQAGSAAARGAEHPGRAV